MLPSPPAEAEIRARSKRKLGDVEAEETRDTSFQLLKLDDDSCLAFEPIGKLLRAHLPLSWLAATHPTDEIASGSLLKGTIPRITTWEYSTLIARLLPNGGLYAVEKVEDEYYVLHTLQPFVTTKWVVDATVGAVPQVNMQMMLHYLPVPNACETQPANSRRALSISSENELKIAKNRRGIAARLSILGQSTKQESLPASPILPDTQIYMSRISVDKDTALAPVVGCEKTAGKLSGDLAESDKVIEESSGLVVDMLSPDYLRQRYLETLYTTRSPLSYYSKGPLSRARARARALDASINLSELATFYRDSLLPAKKLDLKYRQSVRETVCQIDRSKTFDIENTKKSKKRTRLGKDGLWPAEFKYITKWWREMHNDTRSPVASDAAVVQAIAALRMRETQMQILLILEVLSIEAKQSAPLPGPIATSAAAASPDQTAEVKVESIEKEDDVSKQSQKSTKKRNLEIDLELLADKLCIWHSIGLEDSILSKSPTTEPKIDDLQDHSRDSLRHFCSEVLIPFYSSKLPIICRALCKTLAGSELYDRAAKSSRLKDDNLKSVVPGAALLRRPPSRSNTLDRVLSDNSLRHSSPPTLLRSATLPPTPKIRETSKTPQRQLSRQASMSLTNREVDLVADANVTAGKKRKLDMVAMQKQELASAIQALKKPNRQALANSFMDDVEARKQKVQKPILITATPRAHRQRALTDAEFAPMPEPLLIPSSGTKRADKPRLLMESPYSQKKKAVLAALQATPSRTSAKKDLNVSILSEIQNPAVLCTPMVEKDAFVFATPAKKGSSEAVDHTPTKQTASAVHARRNDFHVTDVAFKVMDRAMNKPVNQDSESIYAQLGWDDDQSIDV